MNEKKRAQILKTYDSALSYLTAVYEAAEFTQWLQRAALVNFVDGVFVIEVPSERGCNLLTRHSERLAVLTALQAAAPAERSQAVGVEFVVGQGKQVAPEPDYLELEEMV